MATLTSDWVPLIASAWTRYTPIGYRSLALIAAIALLSYIFGYLASQMQFPEHRGADSKLPRKQGRDDLG
jgi:hypothetical protein